MDFETLSERLVADYLVPVLLGGIAACSYLGILARAHLKARLILGLYKEAGRRRLQQEEIKRREGDAPHLQKYERLEQGLLKLLEREGMRPAPLPPAPPPAAAPVPPRVVKR